MPWPLATNIPTANKFQKCRRPSKSKHYLLYQLLLFTNLEILRVDHHVLIANSMRDDLDALDSNLAEEMKMYVADGAMEDPNDLTMFYFTLGAVQQPQTLLQIEELHGDMPSFQRFRIKLNTLFSTYDITQADNGNKIKLKPDDTVSLCFITTPLNGRARTLKWERFRSQNIVF